MKDNERTRDHKIKWILSMCETPISIVDVRIKAYEVHGGDGGIVRYIEEMLHQGFIEHPRGSGGRKMIRKIVRTDLGSTLLARGRESND